MAAWPYRFYPISLVCHRGHPKRAQSKPHQAEFSTYHKVAGAKSCHTKHLFYRERIFLSAEDHTPGDEAENF